MKEKNVIDHRAALLHMYIWNFSISAHKKTTMYLKRVLVLPLHKVLAVVRTILTLTDTSMHACWKWQEEIAICWAHCLEHSWHTHAHTDITHTHANGLFALSISLSVPLHITVMRFEKRNGYIQRLLYWRALLYTLNISNANRFTHHFQTQLL